MSALSSNDEMFLLVILQLKDNAYGVTIRRKISEITAEEWSIGAVYDPLYRLEKRGLIESCLSDPTQERGGRSKRMFRVLQEGLEALIAHKRVRDQLWRAVGDITLASG